MQNWVDQAVVERYLERIIGHRNDAGPVVRGAGPKPVGDRGVTRHGWSRKR